MQCLVLFLLVGKLMRKIFFGTLRAAELEHLIERAWYAVTETCLIFTVFRDDLNAKFVSLFAILLFLKCFHWLVEDRVDFMERNPNIVILFHIRIVSLLIVLAMCDMAFIYYSHVGPATEETRYQLIFGFEYAILLASILNIVIKYILHWIDIASDSPWDEKAACLLYLELLMSVIKLFLYSAFVMQMLRFHSFPLFVLRPIYLCIRTFKKACSDVIMSRRAIRNMNTLYPTVTQEELLSTDNVCIICREEMNAESGTVKKLPCNHIFHVTCLRSWFQRQQTCPTCRMDILRLPTASGTQPTRPQPNQPGFGSMPGSQSAPSSSVTHQGAPNQQASPHTQVIIQDQVLAVMIQTLAQMFVQAMLTHIQTLNQQQQQQQNQQNQQQPQAASPQPVPSTSSSSQTSSPPSTSQAVSSATTVNTKETRDASTQTDDNHNLE